MAVGLIPTAQDTWLRLTSGSRRSASTVAASWLITSINIPTVCARSLPLAAPSGAPYTNPSVCSLPRSDHHLARWKAHVRANCGHPSREPDRLAARVQMAGWPQETSHYRPPEYANRAGGQHGRWCMFIPLPAPDPVSNPGPQRDPIPHALHPPLAFSPTLHGPPQTPLDDKRKLARQLSQGPQLLATSPKTLASLMPGPPPIPTPDMFIDPSIRLPPPQPQAPIPPQPSQADVHIDHRHSQSPGIGRPPTNNLDLLVAAFDTQRGVTMPPPAAGHITPEEYYGNPHLTATNDGYENELQFYIDGGQNLPQSVWGGGMYSGGGY